MSFISYVKMSFISSEKQAELYLVVEINTESMLSEGKPKQSTNKAEIGDIVNNSMLWEQTRTNFRGQLHHCIVLRIWKA
jgi:hypothetical protein